jgi:hypothetical protein
MKYLVIGTGAIGLNIANQLKKQNIDFDIITKSNNNESYKYPNAIVNNYNISKITISMIFFKKINFLWILLAIFNIPFYKKKKNFIINKSLEILKKYNFKNCNNNNIYFNNKIIFNDLLNNVKDKIIYKTVTNNDIINYSILYDKVFVCVGHNYNQNNLIQNIGSFKFYCECKNKPNCLIIENGYFIEPHDSNNITIKCGLVIGSNNENYDHNYISNKLKNSYIWNKYKITKINNITMGLRSVSFDFIPYYNINKNIYYVTGGSFNGFIFAPYLAQQILKDDKYFNICRLRKKILLLYLIIFIGVLFIFFKLYFTF